MDSTEKEMDSSPPQRFPIRSLLLFVFAGILLYLIILLFGQIEQMILAFTLIPLWVIPILFGLSFSNYIFRYGKWQYFLRRTGVAISHSVSFRIFLAGFTLTATPGKMGEAVKGYLLNESQGTPVATGATVVISERITDLLAIIFLALLAITLNLGEIEYLPLILLLGMSALIGASILGRGTFVNWLLKRLTSKGPLRKYKDSCSDIEHSLIATLSPRPMIVGTLISIPGWFMECIGLWLLMFILSGYEGSLISQGSIFLLISATIIHTVATLIGTISPGGLAVYETISIALMQTLVGLSYVVSGAASIFIRVLTLWFSILVGFAAFGTIKRKEK